MDLRIRIRIHTKMSWIRNTELYVFVFSNMTPVYTCINPRGTECTECRLYFQSSELGQPTPSTASESCSSPPLGPMGETHSLAGKGVGGPNPDEGTDTPVLNVFYSIILYAKSAQAENPPNMCEEKILELMYSKSVSLVLREL